MRGTGEKKSIHEYINKSTTDKSVLLRAKTQNDIFLKVYLNYMKQNGFMNLFVDLIIPYFITILLSHSQYLEEVLLYFFSRHVFWCYIELENSTVMKSKFQPKHPYQQSQFKERQKDMLHPPQQYWHTAETDKYRETPAPQEGKRFGIQQ